MSKQRHDDVHYPLQGRGAKAKKPKSRVPVLRGAWRKCKTCSEFGPIFNDHYCSGKAWVMFDYKNSTEATVEQVSEAWNDQPQ